MEKRFLGNIGSGKLHALDYADGRCKIDAMKEENKVFFSTLEEGLSYPSPDAPCLKKCGICIPNYYKNKKEKEK